MLHTLLIVQFRTRLQSIWRTIDVKPKEFAALSILLLTPFMANLTAASQNETSPSVFRFHSATEFHSLDPIQLPTNEANYFFGNIMRGLLRYSPDGDLTSEGAKSCRQEPTRKRVVCELKRDARWSDGSGVVAEDYVRSFRRFFSPQAKSPAIALLKNLKNAREIQKQEMPAAALGVVAENPHRLIFQFAEHDSDFLFKLTSSVFVPLKSDTIPDREHANEMTVNGPYKIAQWSIGRRMRLEANPLYRGTGSTPLPPGIRPPVEILFVDEEQTVVSLYESGQLSFVKYLPTTLIPTYEKKKDFIQVPFTRFDYVGFSDFLRDQPDLRAAMSLAADFRELKTIYRALGIPGCPSFPESFLAQPECVQFNLVKAKEHLAKVPEEIRKRRIKFLFSKLGGSDFQKGMEWFQAQWKKNLGLIVDLEQTEQVVLTQKLKTNPPAVFRRGVPLDRPTCLAALEVFASDSPDNFIGFKNEKYEKVLLELKKSQSTQKLRTLCSQGLQILLAEHAIIPLGRIHFSMLARPQFSGWTLNEMNQLDLSQLRDQSAAKNGP